jgi:hypothetical protein
MCSVYAWQDGRRLSPASDIRYDREAMRAVPHGLGLSHSCVGPARVFSAGGKWYVLVIVDNYYSYAWVFFLADNGGDIWFCPRSNLEVEERE